MRIAALVALIVLAGCVGPAEAPPPEVPEELGTREATTGTTLDFAVPRPATDARYLWSFGDGGSHLGPNARHAWTEPGVYSVAWQEMRGEEVVRSSVGLVLVHETLSLSDEATPEAPSEAAFEVGENATSITFRFTAPKGEGVATALLVDPTGNPVATETLDLAESVDLTLSAKDPAPGEWLVYVESPNGALAWTAAGTVKYGEDRLD